MILGESRTKGAQGGSRGNANNASERFLFNREANLALHAWNLAAEFIGYAPLCYWKVPRTPAARRGGSLE